MRFLIENYSNPGSTQPMYFNKHINDVPEHQSMIRHNNASIFDIFDTFNPDVYISSINTLSKDSLLYLQENQDIKLLISIDGLAPASFINLENILQSYNVKCHFFFSSSGKSPSRKNRFVTIRNGADINVQQNMDIKYSIDKCIVFQKEDPSRQYSKEYNGTYHVITNNRSLVGHADAYLPITLMPSVYGMYNEVVFTDIGPEVPQVFFDALYYGNKVYYDIKDESSAKKVDDAIASIFGETAILNYQATNRTEDFSEIKNIVREKHSSLNRTKTLLSQLPQKV